MRVLFSCLLGAVSAAAHASLPYTDANYDADVPTVEEVLGHASGAEISSPEEVIAFMEALAAAEPERMKLFEYARTWEGRPLVYGVIASEENMARLDEIKEGLATLSDGGPVTARRARMVRDLPAVVWLGYGVHGNEITSSDAALGLAYHLLASEDDEQVEAILENTIVLIDPMQNPDGRARFVANFEQSRGLEISGDRFAAERDEPWPGGRSNHYLFDMNRDWFTLSQPETQGKIDVFLEWNPVVVVDAHEMGSDSTYFFPPAARPFNPQLSENSREGQGIIGREIAAAFDETGVPYFTRETFDNLYPGFGDMWPALRGAVAMTFEQASPRGLIHDREVGEPLTYEEGVRNHFLSTLTTAYALAENKERFLRAYAEDRATAVSMNQGAEDRYTLIDLASRPSQGESLAAKLTAQGIDVQRLAPRASVCGTQYADGAIVVDRAQPNGRLARTLLDRNTPMADDFVAEQEGRRARGLGHELYDVTAWSLPLMEGLAFGTCQRVPSAQLSAWEPLGAPEALAEAAFGYALPWDDAGQAKLLVAALREGLRGFTTDVAFTQGDNTLPRGSVVFTEAMNGDDLQERLNALLQEHGGTLVPMATSWVDEGPNFGSGHFSEVSMPKVALAWGNGASSLSAGSLRYVLERRLGVPVTPIRLQSMSRADLGRYDVLIVPELWGSLTGTLGGRGTAAVKEFAEEGGVLIGVGSALGSFGEGGLELLSLQSEQRVSDGESNGRSEGSSVPGTELWSEEDYQKAISSGAGRPDRVPGVLLNTDANPDHFLSAGYDNAVALFRGSTIYAPLMTNQGTNVFTYKGPDEVLASGYLWEDVRTQIARKPYLVARSTGSGMVVGFTQDPTTRAYLGGLDLMLANAVVLAPAYTD